MSKKNFEITVVLAMLYLTLTSCSQGTEEGKIAKNITLSTSKVAVVLPNNLSDTLLQTCVAGGVQGPRVRMKASFQWLGTEGDLLPLVIRMTSEDTRLDASISATISPGSSASTESLAFMFSDGTAPLATDYIPGGTTNVFSTTECFLDYGGLPAPVTELKGTNQLEIPVTISMMGVVRDANGEDTPFVKEVNATITYVAGSVPPD